MGLWLVHGDEPLMVQWLIDACRPIWQAHRQHVSRLELTSAKSWLTAESELASLSLFDDNNALIITGNHKPDAAMIATLAQFADEANQGAHGHHLLWCLPKQDKKSQATKALRLFAERGMMIEASLPNERARRELLQVKAQEFGLTLTNEAWSLLLTHTEHNLLTAYQTLWRLSFLYPNATIDGEILQAGLVEGAAFSSFDLSDAMLGGNPNKSLQILHQLRQSDTAPSRVLWTVATDARHILQLQAGKSPDSLGIWRSKQSLYTAAARRTHAVSHAWAAQIFAIDKAIKGVSGLDAWQLLHDLVLSIASGEKLPTAK